MSAREKCLSDARSTSAGSRRLALALGVSLAAHAAGVPPLCILLLKAHGLYEGEQRRMVVELTVEDVEPTTPTRQEPFRIHEPIPAEPPPKEPLSALPPPINDTVTWERPRLEPPPIHIPAGRFRTPSPCDRVRSWSSQNTPEPEPQTPRTPVLDSPEPMPDFFQQQWPDEPPPSLWSGLPNGSFSSGAGEPLLNARDSKELIRRVYSQRSFPDDALDRGVEGQVIVRFRLDSAGKPLDVEIREPSSPDESLRSEAIRMILAGAPYPVPTIRHTIEFFVAVAYRNTPDAHPDKLVVVRPSSNKAIDQFALRLATADAARDEEEGWRLVSYAVRAVFDLPPSGPKHATLVSLEGDSRWAEFLTNHKDKLLSKNSGSGFLQLPIRFTITDR